VSTLIGSVRGTDKRLRQSLGVVPASEFMLYPQRVRWSCPSKRRDSIHLDASMYGGSERVRYSQLALEEQYLYAMQGSSPWL